MFYSFENMVCLLLEDVLKKSELYFIEVYKQGQHYYMKDKLFLENAQISTNALIKLFGVEHSLYFLLTKRPIPMPYIILRWSEETKGYTARFINNARSGAETTPFNPKYERTTRTLENFFNQLHPLIQLEAEKIKAAIAQLDTNRMYGDWEIEDIISRIYEEKLYTPPSFH